MRRFLLLVIVFILLGASQSVSAAESTVNCHCFTDRSYDQQNPEKVVPYLLATTQNSFLSVAFRTPKFKLVKELMSGVPSDQLWISNYFAAKFNYDIKSLMLLRAAKGSWLAGIDEAGIKQELLAPQLVAALEAKDDQQLAMAVVDEALLFLMGVDPQQLKELRKVEQDNRQLILSFFLAQRTGQIATELYRSVAAGETNWGTLAFVNNVQIGEMEQEFKKLLDQ